MPVEDSKLIRLEITKVFACFRNLSAQEVTVKAIYCNYSIQPHGGDDLI